MSRLVRHTMPHSLLCRGVRVHGYDGIVSVPSLRKKVPLIAPTPFSACRCLVKKKTIRLIVTLEGVA